MKQDTEGNFQIFFRLTSLIFAGSNFFRGIVLVIDGLNQLELSTNSEENSEKNESELEAIDEDDEAEESEEDEDEDDDGGLSRGVRKLTTATKPKVPLLNDLQWLPMKLPDSVHIIVSTTPGLCVLWVIAHLFVEFLMF